MGNTVHKPGINLMSYATLIFCFFAFATFRSISRENRRRAVFNNSHQLIGFIYSVCNLTLNNLLTFKSIHRYFRISCYYYTVSCSYIFICKDILCSRGTPGFYLNLYTRLISCFLKTFGSHISMSDSGRT